MRQRREVEPCGKAMYAMHTVAAKKATSWGAKLQDLRESKGLTQVQTAAFLEVPLKTLRNWEQGRTEPAPYVCRLITRRLESYGS